MRVPGAISLEVLLRCDDKTFVDLIKVQNSLIFIENDIVLFDL